MTAEPALITLDVGGTLGVPERPGLTATLLAASRLDRTHATRILRDLIHVSPAITDRVVNDVCHALQIPVAAFPRDVSAAQLRLFDATPQALRRLSAILPLVTLSNVTCVEADLDRLSALLHPWVADHFPSCRTGYAKPDHRAFRTVADHRGVDIDQIIHIGDHWECDILGAAHAGATAVWISGGRPTPPLHPDAHPKVHVAADLAGAVAHVNALCARRTV
jgi:FMN phosphatase YigB (HAD superfamily)